MTKAKTASAPAGKTLIATTDTFTKGGRYVPRGAPLSADEIDYDKKTSTNVTDAPTGALEGAAVQVSAIAPSGPNPTAPQQIAPGTVQSHDGYYDRGVRVVGEVTVPEKQRRVQLVDGDDTTQGDVQKALDDHAAEHGNAASNPPPAA